MPCDTKGRREREGIKLSDDIICSAGDIQEDWSGVVGVVQCSLGLQSASAQDPLPTERCSSQHQGRLRIQVRRRSLADDKTSDLLLFSFSNQEHRSRQARQETGFGVRTTLYSRPSLPSCPH